MNKTWEQIDKENEEFCERQLQQAKKKSPADRDFFEAALSARQSMKQDDLFPHRDENGELRYTVRQGLKAACSAREDAAVTATIQRSILVRLDGIKTLLWLCAAMLVYIAIRVS
jgi:hypothetical protein